MRSSGLLYHPDRALHYVSPLECPLLLRLGCPVRGNFVSGEKGAAPMAPHVEEGDCRPAAEQAGKEADPLKLLTLIGKPCCALEGG